MDYLPHPIATASFRASPHCREVEVGPWHEFPASPTFCMMQAARSRDSLIGVVFSLRGEKGLSGLYRGYFTTLLLFSIPGSTVFYGTLGCDLHTWCTGGVAHGVNQVSCDLVCLHQICGSRRGLAN